MKKPYTHSTKWITGSLCAALMLGGCGMDSGRDKQYAVEMMDSSVDQAAHQPSDLDPAFAEDQLAFAFDLYRELQPHKDNPQDNDTISPVSIATALSMTMNGAATDTLTEMEQALHSTDRTAEARNLGYEVLADLLTHSGKGAQVSLANSLWMREPLQFKDDFLTKNQSHYNTEMTSLNFADDDATKRINSWVREQTAGKIQQMFEHPIDDETILLLLNTVYFKGTWQQEFKPESTRTGSFTTAAGQQQDVSMMHNGGYFSYVQADGMQMIRLPYKDSGLGMIVILPDEQLTLDALLGKLSPEQWQTWKAGLDSRQGHIGLPKFKLESQYVLNDTLQALGMRQAFDVGQADFTPMIELEENVFIGEVKHKTFIEVDEKGTEAAAATSVGMEAGSAQPEDPFDMVVDRPFFFAIEDERTSALLFMGSVRQIPE
ncbi:serpin family protein [Paenibacillus sp. 1P07SE]|uniref:serpin family protein n=1 Tax=Paenibacillus sp. 1P07SE TaxID=3132209 RepID=UPI0039A5CFBD